MADSKNERGLADFALVKQGESPDSTVQDKIGEVSSSEAWTERYGGFYRKGVNLFGKILPTTVLAP